MNPPDPSPKPSPWWSPARHADRRPFLLARNRIAAQVRRWFEGQDFVETALAALAVSPGAEAHLHAFATEAIDPDGEHRPFYLHTSPEFAAKKLLAAGEPKLFEMARVWRNRERGPLHHPEFTMLEWYRAGEPYEAIMADCAAVMRLAAEAAGTKALTFRGREADPFAEPERLTLAEAFGRYARIDLLATIESDSATNREALAAAARDQGVRIAPDDTWADVFSRVLVEKVEPNLGFGRATILCEYPASQAALARPKPGDPRVAERFELYACGVELANGFSELTDAAEQRRRFTADMALKRQLYGVAYPIDEDFLAALEHGMPDCAGIALGVDRLVMLLTGVETLEQALWAPVHQG